MEYTTNSIMSDDDDGVTVVDVTRTVTTATPNATIDLCNDDNNEDEGVMDAYCSMAHATSTAEPSKKKRRKQWTAGAEFTKMTTMMMTSDFVRCVDRDGTINKEEENDNNETRYRQALGPARMEFMLSSSSCGWPEFSAPHAFGKQRPPTKVASRALFNEFVEYQLNLPVNWSSSIFCRVPEARSDLLRILITGPEGTPYANGCFFFDLYLHNYPQQPPKVKYLTTGNGKVRFNPNLYECGKVCLSLLGTWAGPGWEPAKSTILQVLVSIQGLILVPDPYFNEPGYEHNRSTAIGQKESDKYNANIRRFTLQYAILDFVQRAARSITNHSSNSKDHDLYPEFAQVVMRHFAVKAGALQDQIQEWTRQDSSLASLANQIQQHLAVIVQHYEREQYTKPAATAKTASSKTPETIVLLDD